MTPDQAISFAFRAASREMARGMTSAKAEAYQAFLVQSSNTLENAAKALFTLAKYRPDATTQGQLDALEMHAYGQILQATISSLMALGHFPYLDNIDADIVSEKLC